MLTLSKNLAAAIGLGLSEMNAPCVLQPAHHSMSFGGFHSGHSFSRTPRRGATGKYLRRKKRKAQRLARRNNRR